MIEQKIVIQNKAGVHARPAAMLVQTARQYEAKVNYTVKGVNVDGKNIIPITAAGMQCGTEVIIKADGLDEQEAIDALVELINSKFGEHQ